MVTITDEIIDVSQLLGTRARATPQSTPTPFCKISYHKLPNNNSC